MDLLIASTSTVYGRAYLEYLSDDIVDLYAGKRKLVFIPFARPGGISWEQYSEIAAKAFFNLGLSIDGLVPGREREMLEEAEGIFTGGGNTFVLLKTLYDLSLIPLLQEKVRSGCPYMGSSAGSNIAGMGIETTNDMPIVHPPSLDALGFLPFNLNPHYQDPDQDSKHMGETRETRIREFLVFNNRKVVGLREGSHLRRSGDKLELIGDLNARIFSREGISETEPGNISYLLK